jgi:hypothetical protein
MNDINFMRTLLGSYTDTFMSMKFTKRVKFRDNLSEIRHYPLCMEEKEEKQKSFFNVKRNMSKNKKEWSEEKQQRKLRCKYRIKTKSRFLVTTTTINFL